MPKNAIVWTQNILSVSMCGRKTFVPFSRLIIRITMITSQFCGFQKKPPKPYIMPTNYNICMAIKLQGKPKSETF